MRLHKLPAFKQFILIILTLSIFGFFAWDSNSKTKSEPNVVLVVIDTLRADHLGCYGYTRKTSPHIDNFAGKSTRYTRAIATSPWTVPSHASLFTGLYPFEHGAHTYNNDNITQRLSPDKAVRKADLIKPLHKNHLTLAEIFNEAGYETAALIANTAYLSPKFKMNQGFKTYVPWRKLAPAFNREAFSMLDEFKDKPFFLFLNYMDVHSVYNTSPRPGLLENPAIQDHGELLDKLIENIMPGKGAIPQDLAQKVIDQYDTAIANVDEAFGALLGKLTAMGVYDNTLIILASDHGEYFGEHKLVEHSKDIYEEAIRVPLIIKAPGQNKGMLVTKLASLVDIPNLLLSRMPSKLRIKYLERFPNKPGSHAVITENYFTRAKDLYDERWGHRFDRIRTAIYEWPYKYIESSDENHELYDLEKDPTESKSLIQEKAALAAKLGDNLKKFQKQRRNSGSFIKNKATPVKPDDKLLEELRALGYVE